MSWSGRTDSEAASVLLGRDAGMARAISPAESEVASRGFKFGSGGLPHATSVVSTSTDASKPPKPTLPVLLVPGFMSSGLRVESSTISPGWNGERVWLNLPRLGFSSMHLKGLWDDADAQKLKNKWLAHLMLAAGGEEPEGVRLEAIEGIDGVNCLDPQSLFGLLAEPTYVFAPVVKALRGMGYTCGDDLQAASYDWRLSPGSLEARKGYFERLYQQIERMDKNNTGVVLLGHSMGNKVVPYFLEYAKRKLGQRWIDRHISFWIAAGAPFVGAPAAARATLLGDRMGLEAFLTMPEAVLMGRSFSSSPWLFPVGSHGKGVFFLRRQGMLEVKNLRAYLPGLAMESRRNAIALTVEVKWGRGRGTTEALTTKSYPLGEDGKEVSFDAASNFLQYGGPAELPIEATIMVIVKEKGLKDDRDTDVMRRLGKGVLAGFQVAQEAVKGRKGLGVPRASTSSPCIANCLKGRCNEDGFVEFTLPLDKLEGYSQAHSTPEEWRQGYVSLQARWQSADQIRGARVSSSSAGKRVPVKHPRSDYEPITQLELLEIEGCSECVKVWREHYEQDELYHHTDTDDCPPVGKIFAVYGANMPTEVMYALKIHTVRFKPSVLNTRVVLDDEALLTEDRPGLSITHGIIKEEPGGEHASGDGTVPHSSLQHCQRWSEQLDLVMHPIEKAEHRAMLSDARFHDTLSACLFPKNGFVMKWQSGSSGNKWFDFPVSVSRQLNEAQEAGHLTWEGEINKYRYLVDIPGLVQRNLSTGRERPLRRLMVPFSALLEYLVTDYLGHPSGGYSRSVMLVQNAKEVDARDVARRAVAEDPLNCVVALVGRPTLTKSGWSAQAFFAEGHSTMTFERVWGLGRSGYMMYTSDTRTKPQAS